MKVTVLALRSQAEIGGNQCRLPSRSRPIPDIRLDKLSTLFLVGVQEFKRNCSTNGEYYYPIGQNSDFHSRSDLDHKRNKKTRRKNQRTITFLIIIISIFIIKYIYFCNPPTRFLDKPTSMSLVRAPFLNFDLR